MSEFQLDLGTGRDWYQGLDGFTQGYVEAMFFTDTGYAENEELENVHVGLLSQEARTMICDDCRAFQESNAPLLEQAYERDYEPEQAGRDFWYTRDGHGFGFWDRDELRCNPDTLLDDGLGEKLSNAAEYRARSLYMGDDGLIYLA